MIKVRKIVDRCLEVFFVIAFSMMVILTSYQVITRYIFDKPSAYSEVLAKYIFIWLIFTGTAYVFGKKEHMAILFIKEKFNERNQIIIDMITETITLVFIVMVLLIGGYSQAIMQLGQQDATLPVSVGVIYSIAPISAVLIIFYTVLNQIDNVKSLRSGGNTNG